MSTITTLLDTPKKKSLQSQSTTLRTILKDFERCFAETHGRKPKQTDIKSDLAIAPKYKEYQRVQDVLSGKLAYEKLNDVKPRQRGHERFKSRPDSGIGSSPREKQRGQLVTPRKPQRTKNIEVQNEIEQEAEDDDLEPALLNAIGPTPHRDGKALGLFDLLSRSGSATTPSTARKRKMEELFDETPAKRVPFAPTQTRSGYSQHEQSQKGDLLDFLSGTPLKDQQQRTLNSGRYSRTPQSEGKKFQLSQFFATPETARVLFHVPERRDNSQEAGTMEQNKNLHETPQKELETAGLDATPTYLRRSTSFKDRLLSASMAPGASTSMDSRRPSSMSGPPTLRSFRSSTSNVLKDIDVDRVRSVSTIQRTPHIQRQEDQDCDEHNDELDALRELEAQDEAEERPENDIPRLLVEDSQFQSDNDDSDVPAHVEESQVSKPYKKKGQKRTTKRTNIRPIVQFSSKQIKTMQPRFVAADGAISDEDGADVEGEPSIVSGDDASGGEQHESGNGTAKKSKKKNKSKSSKPAGMINPNAQSHTNYRSLKIRGRSAKATGAGKGKFGRRR